MSHDSPIQPASFLRLTGRQADPATARYAVLPVPYEGTVSYKSGTAEGPAAILDASTQVEPFDEELLATFTEAGVATYPPVPSADQPAEQMRRVRAAAEPILRAGKFLLTLGGEHSITAPLVAAAQAVHGPLSVLQIDAHADLHNRYGGSEYSHACVMRRLLELGATLCQVGIRNVSQEEARDCPQQIARLITPTVIAADPNWVQRALDLLDPARGVYLTIDIDGLDPSIAPGTGTPEPGGLSWVQTLTLLRAVCTARRVVSADIVEVRPIPPHHVTEFLAARLAYKIIAYTQARP